MPENFDQAAAKSNTEVKAGGSLPPRHPSHPPDASPGVIFLRRYRRYVPIPLALITFVWLRPTLPLGSLFLDALTDVVGVIICALGQWIRMWAWGSNAAVGKWGVRDRGPYKLMRHPLYAGNFLILVGLAVIFHNPWAYPLLLLPFAYLYHAITNMEEQRLRRRFGEDYREYRTDEVPRFLPALSNFQAAVQTTLPFGWGLAWRKEFESCCGWLAGVCVLQIYEGVLVRGWTPNWPYTQLWLVGLGFIGVTALALRIRKQQEPFSPHP